jgi:hypothetical protein
VATSSKPLKSVRTNPPGPKLGSRVPGPESAATCRSPAGIAPAGSTGTIRTTAAHNTPTAKEHHALARTTTRTRPNRGHRFGDRSPPHEQPIPPHLSSVPLAGQRRQGRLAHCSDNHRPKRRSSRPNATPPGSSTSEVTTVALVWLRSAPYGASTTSGVHRKGIPLARRAGAMSILKGYPESKDQGACRSSEGGTT